MLIVQVVLAVLTLIGAVTSVWFLVEKVIRWRRLSWRSAQKSSEKIAGRLVADCYLPSLIIGIGRGGAIFGAMISGCMGHRPLLVIDRKYTWQDGRRIDDMVVRIDLPEEVLNSVLLVAGETHTGNTMKLYYDRFLQLGAKQIRRATYFLQDGCTENIEYVAVRSSTDRRMPWMFSQSYMRDSRSQEEARSLSRISSSRGTNGSQGRS